MTGRTWKFYSITVIVQYIKVLTSLWAFSCSNTSTERREGWWGKKNTWYQFWSNGFQGVHICCVIEMQSSASLPPPIFVVYGTACHTFAWVGGTWGRAWVATEKPCIIRVRPLVDLVRQLIRVLFHCTGGRNVGHSASHYRKPFIIRMRPLVDLVRQLIRVLSSILAGWFVPSLLRAQPHAPPAYHYQASGPYCITDGADRRERRQPACFLERLGVCSWVREEGGKKSEERGRKDRTENAICLHVTDEKILVKRKNTFTVFYNCVAEV